MNAFIELQLKTGSIIAVSVLLFVLFLAKDNFFKRNRVWLLATIIVPWIVPVMAMPVWLKSFLFKPEAINQSYVLTADIPVVYGEVTVVPEAIDWMQIGISIYAVVCLLFAVRLMWGYSYIYQLKKMGKHQNYKGFDVVLLKTKDVNPFSFFRTIYLPEHLERETNRQMILEHERTHCAQLHSIDISLAEWLLIIQWWNPFVWWLRKLIAQNHEYCVDNAMVQTTKEPQVYQYSLLNLLHGSKHMQLVNNFNQSLTKKRLVMMNKKHTNKIIGWTKGLLVLPLVIVSLLAFTNPDKTSTNAKTVKAGINDEQDLRKHFAKTIKYPLAAQEAGVEGTVTVNFKVDKKGKVSHVAVGEKSNAIKLDKVVVVAYARKAAKNQAGKLTDNEIIMLLEDEAKRVVNALPEMNDKSLRNLQLQIDFEFILQEKVSKEKPRLSAKTIKGEELANNSISLNNSKGEKVTLSTKSNFLKLNYNGEDMPLFTLNKGVITAEEVEQLNVEDLGRITTLSVEQLKQNDKEEWKNGVFAIYTKDAQAKFEAQKPLYIVDGSVYAGDLKDISAEEIARMSVLKGDAAIKKYGKKAKDGAIEITTKAAVRGNETLGKPTSGNEINNATPMFIVDGVELNEQQFQALFPMKYHSQTKLRGQAAVDKYGERAGNGVIEIKTKSADGQLGMKNMAMGKPMHMTPTNVFNANVNDKNAPLLLVDGQQRTVNDVNVEDIEVVTVIKDSEVTKYYGEGSENGVVLIKTIANDQSGSIEVDEVKIHTTKDDPLYVVDGKRYSGGGVVDARDIESVNVVKGKNATDKYGEAAKNGVIEIRTKDYSIKHGDATIIADKIEITPDAVDNVRISGSGFGKDKPYILIDGEEFDGDLKDLDADKINSMTVLKDKSAKELYGDKAEYGVIIIESKIE